MAVSWSTIGALPLTSRKNVEVAFGSGTGTLFQGIEFVGGFNGGIWFLDNPQNLTIRVVTYRNFDFPKYFSLCF